jgi:hypothetical protein
MNTSLLRIGNILFSAGLNEFVQVTEVLEGGVRAKALPFLHLLQDHLLEGEDLTPVSLNHCWLMSLGLAWSEEHEVHEHFRLVVRKLTETEYQLFTPRRMDKLVENVHELQNIFAAIYGEDLPFSMRYDQYESIRENNLN